MFSPARVERPVEAKRYHSLSIEGYRVTLELVEHVRTGDWDPANRDSNRRSRDALAARGYWQTFRLVRETVRTVIAGDGPGVLARAAHQNWYRELFQPSVAAGLIPALAGYRDGPVLLRGSLPVPPRREAVRDVMPTFFDLLEGEAEPSVKAVLGHWLFGHIHPGAGGNGRMARFVMNALLASGGYPWTVIRVDDRAACRASSERAGIDQDHRSGHGAVRAVPGRTCRIGLGAGQREFLNGSSTLVTTGKHLATEQQHPCAVVVAVDD